MLCGREAELEVLSTVHHARRMLYESAEGHPEPDVEDTIDQVSTEYLDLLLDLTGDAYLGVATIDRTDIEHGAGGRR